MGGWERLFTTAIPLLGSWERLFTTVIPSLGGREALTHRYSLFGRQGGIPGWYTLGV